MPSSGKAVDPFPKVGDFSFKSFEAPFIEGIDTRLRRLIATSQDGLFLADVDTMRAVGRIALGFTAGHRIAVDEIHHRVFVPLASSPPPSGRALDLPSIGVIDLATRKVAGTFTFPDAYRGMSIDATGYFARDDKLYVITDMITTFNQATHRLTVHELDASKMLTDPAAALVWSYDLDACNNIPDGGGNFGFIHRSARAEFLYFACDPGNQGPSNGLVRLDIPRGSSVSDTSRFTPHFDFFGGGLADGFVIADGAHDRVAIFANAAGQQKLYVFDVFASAWVGSVQLAEVSLGGGVFDPKSGRVYATQVSGGALVTEGAWLPTPQGLVYPTETSVGAGSPVFDPVTRRLFIPAYRELGQQSRVQDRVLVYEDRIPPQTPAPLENPDSRTQNTKEIEGVTLSTFSGGGSAYGARYLFTGGLQAKHNGRLWPAFQAVGTLYSAPFAAAGHDGQNPPFAPGGPGRTLTFGRVSDTFVDDGTASGESISSDADAVTRADIAQLRDVLKDGDPAELDEAKRQLRSNVAWPYPEAECVDFGGEADKDTDSQRGARVDCDHIVPRVMATASAFPESAGSPIRVGFATSTVDVFRDPKRGLVVRAHAIARNVDILGLLTIGEVETIADSAAFGRPDTATSTYTRRMKQVVVRDTSGAEVYTCGFGEASCDPLVLARVTDRVFPTRIRVDVPQPERDPRIARTPGGAQSIVAKSRHQFWSDFNSNGESSYEVPGLQITVFDDAFPHILQLAGVTADAHYTVTAFSDPPPPIVGGHTIYEPQQPNYPAPVQPPATVVTTPPPVTYLIQRASTGIAFALTHPREGLLFAAMWLLVGTPVYLLSRRRAIDAIKGTR